MPPRAVSSLVQVDLEILYEDGPCFAVLKPHGVATQAPPGIDSMESRVKRFLKQRDAKAGNVYLGIPHRLDRAVSGVLLFALPSRAARRISRQFEDRLVQKTYWACVGGQVSPGEGTWIDHLKKVYGVPRAEVVAADDPDGRKAVLHYRVLGAFPWGTWLEIRLETGRTHQIRVQAASRGWPILGDALYGSQAIFGPPIEDERLRPIALHGRSLSFTHPMTRKSVTILAPLPALWSSLNLPSSLI